MAEIKRKNQKTDAKAKPKFGSRTIKFLKESLIELRKVVWPTKRQLVVNTAVVIIASFITALFISGADAIFNYIDILLLKK